MLFFTLIKMAASEQGSSSFEKEVQKYIKLLHGEGIGNRFKKSNLVYVKNGEKTIEERAKNDICPPTKINPDYHVPGCKLTPSRKTKKESSSRVVDPRILRQIRER